MYSAVQAAQSAFHKAISDLDVSINGKADQFAEAFKAYGTGKENIPNRFQRWFWRLRHIITKEPIVWEKSAGSGAVYINWGSSTCSSSNTINPAIVELLYEGRTSGTPAKAWGGGRNYQCLKKQEPSLSKALNPQPKDAYIDGVDYRTFANPEKTYSIPCAACLVRNTVTIQTFYGRTSCPENWRKEYSGLAMADSSSNVDMDLLCLNKEVFGQDLEQGGGHVSKVNPVWMSCKNCDGEKIVPCSVCSYENKAQVF